MARTIAEQFAEDVSRHTLTVLRDEGVYRHLRLSTPGTYCMSFDIVTWPGHLAYTGDMGDFVFSRLPDMFEFFRRDGPNFQYWAEKCVAADKSDGIEAFSERKFREAIEAEVAEYLESHDDVDADELREAIKDELFSDISEFWSVRAAMEFKRGGFQLHDFWEHRLNDYTQRFKWCCHALPWAISLYDADAMLQARGETR
jgi:hypothetical protein